MQYDPRQDKTHAPPPAFCPPTTRNSRTAALYLLLVAAALISGDLFQVQLRNRARPEPRRFPGRCPPTAVRTPQQPRDWSIFPHRRWCALRPTATWMKCLAGRTENLRQFPWQYITVTGDVEPFSWRKKRRLDQNPQSSHLCSEPWFEDVCKRGQCMPVYLFIYLFTHLQPPSFCKSLLRVNGSTELGGSI